MICPDCNGRGFRPDSLGQIGNPNTVLLMDGMIVNINTVCQTCQGSGIAYCCEGDRCEPEQRRDR